MITYRMPELNQFLSVHTKTKEMIDPSREIRYLLTHRCNRRCYYCHLEGCQSIKNRDEILTVEDYVFLFRAQEGIGLNKVTLSGGEPLLRGDMTEIAKRLFHEGAKINLTSNMDMIDYDPSLLRFIKKIHMSIDYIGNESTNPLEIKAVNPSRLNHLARLLAEYSVSVEVNIVSIDGISNHPTQIQRFHEFAVQTGAKLRYIELYPTSKQGFLDHQALSKLFSFLGYRRVNSYNPRKISYLSNEFVPIDLVYIPCSLAEKGVPDFHCGDMSDPFLTSNGRLKVCFERHDYVSVLDEIKSRNYDAVQEKILRAFHEVGNWCKWRNCND